MLTQFHDRIWKEGSDSHLVSLLAGLFLLDLGSLVASLSAAQLGRKKHQVWLDKKTHRSLRDAAGAAIMCSYTADAAVSWPTLTERHLEKRFGRVRNMYSNCKMSISDFWRSSALNMRKEIASWNAKDPKPPHCFDSGKVSATSFENIMDDALHAAMKFTSICSGRKIEELEALYGQSHSDAVLQAQKLNEDCEDEADDEDDKEDPTAEEMFQHIKESQKVASATLAEADIPDCDDDRATIIHEKAMGKRADIKIAAATAEICGDLPMDETQKLPQEQFMQKLRNLKKTTLAACLKKAENLEACKHDLWMLLCHLRMQPGGCDIEVVKNHLMTRSSLDIKIPKWQNAVRHQLAVIESQERSKQTRTSRQQAWVQSCEELRKQSMPSLPSTLAMESGQIVACDAGSTWQVCLVLSVWRVYKKGVGSQLTCREISKGSVHSVRCAVMRQAFDDQPDAFLCDSSSRQINVPLEKIGVRLDTDEMLQKRALDATKIQLSKATGLK